MNIPFPYSKKEDITIKISSDLCEELVKDVDFSKIVSDKVLALYQRYKDILAASTKELKEQLSESELKCLAGCYADYGDIPENIRSSAYNLALFIENSDKLSDLCDAYFINGSELIDKCRKLTAAQVDAFYTWLKENK